LANAWQYSDTDFGEGHGRSPQQALRAVVGVAAPGAPNRFAAIIDTGGPITVVAAEVLHVAGGPIERDEKMLLRLGGSTNEVRGSSRDCADGRFYARSPTPAPKLSSCSGAIVTPRGRTG